MRMHRSMVAALGGVLAAAMAWSAAPAPPVLIVWAGTLLAVPGEPPLTQRSLIVRNGLIERVVPGFIGASDIVAPHGTVTTLDLSKRFVLPGLIDLHVHLTTEPSASSGLDEVTGSDADLALIAAVNARKTLAAGFTTVMDMGTGRLAHETAIYAVRNAVEAGRIPGPQVLACGSPISAPGSSRTQRFQPAVERTIAPQGTCSGADDCRRAVREQVRRGADFINFYDTGSLLTPNSPAQTFTDEEMRAIVETAHALHRKAIADGGNNPRSAAGVNAAIRAGADAVDTVTYPDPETWTLLAKSGVKFVPHLYALQAAVGDTPETLSQGSMGWLPEPILASLYELKQQTPSAAEALRRGVPMAFASDAGVFEHGRNAGEFAQYVRLGMTPADAIKTATINAAQVFGLTSDRATLEAGKRADFIAVAGDPLHDITELTRVLVVVRGGEVYQQ